MKNLNPTAAEVPHENKPPLPAQKPALGLAQFLATVYDRLLAPNESRRTVFEPRRVIAPEGYHSTKCIAAGLYILGEQFWLTTTAKMPAGISACTLSYRVLEHEVPIYFVDEEFARAVAATQFPDDFTFADLHWPRMAMVIRWPPKFMQQYAHRDMCYVYAANCPRGADSCKGLERAPIIEVPKEEAGAGWVYYALKGTRAEVFISPYRTKGKLSEALTGYTYIDYKDAESGRIEEDKTFTERVSALMLKLLVVLNMQGSLVIHGKQERPQRIKRGKVFKRELWITNFIGQGYRMPRERQGRHASPRTHIR
jgi:hypothetical protein